MPESGRNAHRAAAIPTWHEFVASLSPKDRRDAEAFARLYVQTVREIIAAREAGAEAASHARMQLNPEEES